MKLTSNDLRNPADRHGARRSISLVLPAWNEQESLPRALAEADAALRQVADEYEILIVDDGSTDATAQVVLEIATRLPRVRLIRHEINVGYGAALRSGFAAATKDLVAFTDADNQFDLRELDRFVLLAQSHQAVCGYRIDRQDPVLRKFYSRGYNLVARTLLGMKVRDIDCAFKMFHREVIQQVEITTDGFLVNSEILTRVSQLGCSIVEVGVTHRARQEGTSTVSPWHIPGVLRDLSWFWWNQVQFAGQPHNEVASTRRTEWAAALLLVVAAAVLFSGLGYPLIDRDETRYAEIPREMVITGNWVLPQLNFRPYYDKPPLMYWATAASYTLLGVSEFAARLPHAASCFGALCLTFFFAKRWFGAEAALLSTLALLLSVGFLGSSRVLLIDGLLMLLMTLALCSGMEAIRCETFHRKWWLLAAFACGLAFLAKGPVALVLFAPPLLAYAALSQGVSRPRLFDWVLLIAVVAAMATPWFVAVSEQAPSFAYEFFYKHNVTRFGGAFHAQPVWYFLPVLLIAGHPWSFLSISLTRYLGSRDEACRHSRPRELGFLVLWAGWCVLFFSLSRCKLPSYVMPAFPALAMMMGQYLQRRVLALPSLDLKWLERIAPWNAALMTAMGGVGFAMFCAIDGGENFAAATGLAVGWTVLAVAILWFRRTCDSQTIGWGITLAMASALGVLVTHREIKLYAYQHTLFGPGSSLASAELKSTSTPIVTLSHEWSEAPFYLDREDIKNTDRNDTLTVAGALETSGRVVLVMRSNDHLSDFTEGLPVETTSRLLGQRGRGVVYELTSVASVAGRPTKPPTQY
jgi:4-amino-4-deoxy-L-arabinose transferase-like glycosyltransferase